MTQLREIYRCEVCGNVIEVINEGQTTTLPAQGFAGNVYKLGLSLAITGPTSDAGNPYSKGVEDYFNFVNDTKMLGDDSIDCTIRDDQYKTDITKQNFEDFLDQEIVFYLNYSTGSTLALKKDFEEVHGEYSWMDFIAEYRASIVSMEDELSFYLPDLSGGEE